MRFLLDTHALLWWLDGDRRLSNVVKLAIVDDANEVMVSASTIWKVATKARLGKLPQVRSASRLPEVVVEQGFVTLSITVADAHRAGWLPGRHRDPFDRILVAQAQVRSISIASRDEAIAELGATTFW